MVASSMTARARFWRWTVAAAALGYLLAMVATGRLDSHGHFNVADQTGLLREPSAAVTLIDFMRGERVIHLVKRAGSWQRDDGTDYHAHLLEHLVQAIGLMHTARPVRELPQIDAAKLADYGLQPPRLTVRLRNDVGVLLEFELGGVNPDGILRYLRVGGSAYLVSGFVGEAWEHLAEELFADE
jgi:Domain of unknown function (DUF4340)